MKITPLLSRLFVLGILTLGHLSAAQISDDQLYLSLSPALQRQWDCAQQDIKQAQTQINMGNWHLSKDETAFLREGNADRAHAKGEKMVTKGTAMLEVAEAKMEEVRARALAHYEQSLIKETITYEQLIPVIDVREAPKLISTTILQRLWQQSYQEIHFIGAWTLEPDSYKAQSSVKKLFVEALANADNRNSVSTTDTLYGIHSNNGHPNLICGQDFSAKGVAAIYAELVPIENTNDYLISVRAVDANTLIVLSSVSAIISKIKNGSPEALPLKISFTDKQELVSALCKLKNYRCSYPSDQKKENYFQDRRQVLLHKSLLLSTTDLVHSDVDFLWSVLPTSGADHTQKAADMLWLLDGTNTIDAMSIQHGKDSRMTVGSLTIDQGQPQKTMITSFGVTN